MVEKYDYDVFVSYAVEDKSAIVNELVNRLKKEGVNVWYASNKLQSGSSVNETIKEGMKKSRHAIVVLSPNYLIKEWPRKEYYILWANESNSRRILPIWYNVTLKEVKQFDSYLSDIYGVDYKQGIDFVVSEFLKIIGPHSDIFKEKQLYEHKKKLFYL